MDLTWAQAGLIADGMGAGIIALGAMTLTDAEVRRAADPGLEELADVRGLILLRQDNRAGAAFLLAGFVLQLLSSSLPACPPEGWVLFGTVTVYGIAYLFHRRQMAEAVAVRIRAGLTGKIKAEVDRAKDEAKMFAFIMGN